jgi:antitoxin (DNA-binding transcriptional repressor) of toxin-antitoxin stability system
MNTKTTTQPKKITIRDLARNTRAIKEAVKQGQSFVVYEKTTPVFDIYPSLSTTERGATMLELKNLKGFITKKSNDDRSIDTIVYGG